MKTFALNFPIWYTDMKQDLKLKKITLDDNTVLIKKFIKGIEGGRTLDVSEYTEDVIKAGHVIIKKENGNYAPLKVSGSSYVALQGSESYAGLLYGSILKDAPAGAIMTWGIVNEEALPYPVPADFKTAMPHIDYQKDEEA